MKTHCCQRQQQVHVRVHILLTLADQSAGKSLGEAIFFAHLQEILINSKAEQPHNTRENARIGISIPLLLAMSARVSVIKHSKWKFLDRG